jgi:uncharacterized protein
LSPQTRYGTIPTIAHPNASDTTMPFIVPLPHDTAGAPSEAVASERVIAGHPVQTIANVYSSADQAFHCGVWKGGAGAWRVRYSEHEFCHMLAGRIRIVGDDDSELMVAAGDSFVIPAGFSGIWEVLEAARKLYAVYEPGERAGG